VLVAWHAASDDADHRRPAPGPGLRARWGRRRAALEVSAHADTLDRVGLGIEAGAIDDEQALNCLGTALAVALWLGEKTSKSLRCAERPA